MFNIEYDVIVLFLDYDADSKKSDDILDIMLRLYFSYLVKNYI